MKSLTRRSLLGSSTAALMLPVLRASAAQTPATSPVTIPTLAIDVVGGPDYMDPALARSTRDWSIVHAVYDSIVHVSDSGEIVPLAAESVTRIDDLTLEVVLREGLTFHDGTPVESDAIRRGIEWVQASEGPAVNNFAVIAGVEEVDVRTARITTSEPAAWLLSQLAVWHVLFPASVTAETFTTAPIGSGPYCFVSAEPGARIVLERNPHYTWNSPKGVPIADEVTYRFVPESVTRIADLSTGQANLIQAVPLDQFSAVEEAGGTVIEAPILGVAMLRIATDVPPFDDPRVGQALNYAIDVETIAQELVAPAAHRLASLFPDARGIGFDPSLAPFAYDPERARALLAEAGHGDGLDLTLEFVASEREDLMSAIAGYLAEVGVNVSIVATELATFNSTWKAPESGQLRFVSWRPVFDPHTLISLLFSANGPLSRYVNPDADALIAAAAADTDPESRAATYRQLAALMQEVPGAVYLWNLSTAYGIDGSVASWTPRADEYLIPTSTGSHG